MWYWLLDIALGRSFCKYRIAFYTVRFGKPLLETIEMIDVQIFNFSKIVVRQTTVNRGR